MKMRRRRQWCDDGGGGGGVSSFGFKINLFFSFVCFVLLIEYGKMMVMVMVVVV